MHLSLWGKKVSTGINIDREHTCWKWMVTTRWERLLVAFILVAATDLFLRPCISISSIWLALFTGTVCIQHIMSDWHSSLELSAYSTSCLTGTLHWNCLHTAHHVWLALFTRTACIQHIMSDWHSSLELPAYSTSCLTGTLHWNCLHTAHHVWLALFTRTACIQHIMSDTLHYKFQCLHTAHHVWHSLLQVPAYST